MELSVKVTSISWVTHPYGYVKPYFHFAKVGKEGFITAHGHNARLVLDKRIQPGSVIQVTLPDDEEKEKELYGPSFKDVISSPEEPVALPIVCTVCKSTLVWKGLDLLCPSFRCNVQERSVIHRLLCCLDTDLYFMDAYNLEDHELRHWLDEFPTQGGLCGVEIQDIRGFLQQFKQAGPKGTANRLKVLDIHFPGYGVKLHRLERDLEAKLNGGITYEEFWFIQSLPGFNREVCQTLKEIDPLCTTLQRITAMGLREDLIETLAIYQDRWIDSAQYWKCKFKFKG